MVHQFNLIASVRSFRLLTVALLSLAGTIAGCQAPHTHSASVAHAHEVGNQGHTHEVGDQGHTHEGGDHGHAHEDGDHRHDDDRGEMEGLDHEASDAAAIETAGGHVHWKSDPDDPCSCVTAQRLNGWCGACGVGYVAGTPVESAMLHEALDAHGHDIDPASIECVSCRKAMRSDAYCDACQWGFVDEKLYVSRLTWSLARGQELPAGRIACATCRRNASAGTGWCEACGAGMVGNVVFDDRAMYEIGTTEHARLVHSMAVGERCELCGTASFMGSYCPKCGISYGR